MNKLLIFAALIAFAPSLVQAQGVANYEPSDERSSFQARKKSVMDGNLLRATYHNYGQGGKLNPNEFPDEFMYEFPRNTGREYMLFVMSFIGAEVHDQSTPAEDPFAIVDMGNMKTSFSGDSWSLNPITGYAREDTDEMARSDRGPNSPLGNTWPNAWPDKFRDGGDGWAGSWNGYFGRDQFNADVEFYYKAGDDLYTRYSQSGRFQPDSTDASRGGLAIIMDTRVLAWSQTLINATHFNLFEIQNDGTTDYRKVAFGLWVADFIGGGMTGDEPEFDDLRSIVYLKNINRELAPEYFEGPAGEMGLQFLETPGNSIDGIDNDGDSNFFNPASNLYTPGNPDLYAPLTTAEGGFFTMDSLVNKVIPEFTAADFQEKTLYPGDKIVLIQDNGDRVITEYPQGGGTVYSRGKTWNLPASGLTVQEDIVGEASPYFEDNNDQLDNNFNGLIDENRPNHLTKATFVNNQEHIIPVRYINYLNFEVGDTLKRGLVVPNRVIRERMNNDPSFRQEIEDYQAALAAVHTRRNFDDYYFSYKTAAPMIDEARDDYFDNDMDWNSSADDVGIEGNKDRPTAGAGDGYPTSGANTTFPGEPNIDNTDVSESDQLGVTRATIFGSGVLNAREDQTIWNRYMIPGPFERTIATDSDVFISSGLFPLAPGQVERFAVAITAAQTFSDNAADDRAAVSENLEQAYNAYENDYQFAVAPKPPIVKAVAGNGRVTLYWEDNSEDSFDRYIERITGDGYDFEGYKIYRATDDAFEDAHTITNALGNAQFHRPLAIFDKNNGIKGFHPIPVNGVQFNLGNDSGLRYSFVDENVVNGKEYYYAVTAFDYGAEVAGIAPSESPIQISRNVDGSITLGQNVVSIRPSDTQAGYVSPDNPEPTLISGSPGGTVQVEVVDPSALKAEHTYAVVFEDTLVTAQGSSVPELVSKNFSLLDVTTNSVDTLIARSESFNREELPVTDGFRIRVQNIDELRIDDDRSGWVPERDTMPHHYDIAVQENQKVSDYIVVIGDSAFSQSTAATIATTPGGSSTIHLASVATNFKIFNTYTDKEIKYAFWDNPRAQGDSKPGDLSALTDFTGRQNDIVIFIEEYRGEQDKHTYRLQLSPGYSAGEMSTQNPQPGDTLKIFTTKPFSQNDRYEFTMSGDFLPNIDEDLLKDELKDIKVVPNPYIVTNPYEQRNSNINTQIQRELHFTNMPVPSTLRIFTIAGNLVREIEITESDIRRAGGAFGGTYIWNMLTKDNLEISYGVYLYHVKAPGIGSRTGKFAVIK